MLKIRSSTTASDCYFQVGHPPPLYVTFSVCPSIRPSIFGAPYLKNPSCFQGSKRAKNESKLPILARRALHRRNCRSHHEDFWYAGKKLRYLQGFFFIFLKDTVNIKGLTFLLAHFNSSLNKQLIFKFMNKCQKEILRCAPPSSHVCDFSYLEFGVWWWLGLFLSSLFIPNRVQGYMGACIEFFCESEVSIFFLRASKKQPIHFIVCFLEEPTLIYVPKQMCPNSVYQCQNQPRSAPVCI